MNEGKLKQLKSIFKLYPAIKLVYFFGSRAEGKAGPLSDYDSAFYAEEKDINKLFELKFKLLDRISHLFKTDKVEVVILNLAESPELKYTIIKDGKLLYEKEPFRIIFEPKVLNEYFDFRKLLSRYNLTRT